MTPQRTGGLSPQATKLLIDSLSSIERLELLAMLARAPDRRASIVDLARDARLPAAIARRVVRELELATLVEVTTRGLVRLAPRERDRAAVDEIVEIYTSYPEYVTSLLARRR